MTSKKDLIKMLDGKTAFSNATLSKMTIGELKTLVGDDKPVENKQKQKEPVVVAKSKPRRREPVLREFSDSESEQDENPDEPEEEEPEKKQEKEIEVKQKQRVIPSKPSKSKNKIKAPTLSVEAPKELTPPPSPKLPALTTSELRKVLRADYFKAYENDVKEVLCEYKNNELTLNQVVQEYTILRDDFLIKLNTFLDTQRKLSDTQLDYIDSLLQRVADRVESELG